MLETMAKGAALTYNLEVNKGLEVTRLGQRDEKRKVDEDGALDSCENSYSMTRISLDIARQTPAPADESIPYI